MTEDGAKKPSDIADDDLEKAVSGAGKKAQTRVWGDPHITEREGTNWYRKKTQLHTLASGKFAAKSAND